jgi:predicted TIM-barrel fold metal-dependent hydrolase
MDCVGVDAALVNARPEYCDAAVTRYPDRFVACPFADLRTTDADRYVATCRNRPEILALRVVIRRYVDGQLTEDFTQGRLDPIFAAAERHQLPIFMQAAAQLKSAAEVAKAYPELSLIIDHLGLSQQPSIVGDDPWADLADVVALSQFPNVTVKFCGAPTLAHSPFPYHDVWPHLHRLITAFTPDRLMWGSDFTRLRIGQANQRAPREQWYGSYAEQVHFLRDTAELSSTDKEAIFGKTLRRTLNWPATVAARA